MTSSNLRFDLLGPDEYERGKRVLDKAKHPGFVGREAMFRCATRGRVVVAVLDGRDVGIVLVDHKATLGTLSVIPEARKSGVGSALVLHVRPLARFINAIADRVSYFERLGYRTVGGAMIGASGKLTTQLLQRNDEGTPSETGEASVAPATIPTIEARATEALDDPLTRYRHSDDDGPGVLAHLPALERLLQSRAFPGLSPWWMETFTRFYSTGCRQSVLRVGRRGGKSSSLCRIAVLEALFGEHVVSPGDLNIVAIVSVDRREAAGRMRLIKSILGVLGVAWKPIENGIELVDRGVGFQVFTASVSGVSGFSCVCAICDEVAKWRDYDTGSNPATEVLASLRPTLAGQPNARLFLSSSAMGTRDAHAVAFAIGDTAFQQAAFAETWLARPSLTEEDCRLLEPDPEVFAREYACIPFDGSTAAIFTMAMLEGVTRKGLREVPPDEGVEYFAAQDPANRGGNGWTLTLARSHVRTDGLVSVSVVACREWRASPESPLDSDRTLAEIAAVLTGYRVRELWTDQWSFDALSALAVRHGIDLRLETSTQESKVQTFDALRRRAIDRTLELPNDPLVRADLLGVSKWIAKGGTFAIELDKHGSRHSDYAPSIALAVAKASEAACFVGRSSGDFAV